MSAPVLKRKLSTTAAATESLAKKPSVVDDLLLLTVVDQAGGTEYRLFWVKDLPGGLTKFRQEVKKGGSNWGSNHYQRQFLNRDTEELQAAIDAEGTEEISRNQVHPFECFHASDEPGTFTPSQHERIAFFALVHC